MTRKHYIAIAKAIAELDLPKPNKAAVADTIADCCQADNPRFDRARFLAACGIES